MTVQEVKLKRSNPDLIAMVKGLLAQCEAGEIVSLAVAAAHNDGGTSNSFLIKDRPIALLGELLIVQRDVTDCCVDLRLHEKGGEY